MNRHPKIVLVAAAFALGACEDEEHPGFRDCLEWSSDALWHEQGVVPLDGSLHLRFSDWVQGAQAVIDSPEANFKPRGYFATGSSTSADADFVAVASGCALDGDGNLWRLATSWTISTDETPPIPVSVCDDSAADCDGNSSTNEPPAAMFEGYALVCIDADCTKEVAGASEWEVLSVRTWDLTPAPGGGTVSDLSRVEPVHVQATVTVERSPTSVYENPVVVELDVTYPVE